MTTTLEATIESMFAELEKGDEIFRPSAMWQAINRMNMADLSKTGFDNFKRTVARTYFTWVTSYGQLAHLGRHTKLKDWPSVLQGATSLRDEQLSVLNLASMSVLTKMLWLFAQRNDPHGLLTRLAEPATGSPFDIRLNGQPISQDLANSVIEYQAIRDGIGDSRKLAHICELGAGYGRDAFIFLSLAPDTRYTIVDIPPALYVSQRYLTTVFPDMKAFTFRPFDDYSEIASEFEAAQISFLLPHQAAKLPSKTFDLFINISSLHEMLPKQIDAYLKLIDRLTSGWFYSKQWRVSHNRFDKLVLREDTYPIPSNWKQIYKRTPLVQRAFVEALYAIGDPAASAASANGRASGT